MKHYKHSIIALFAVVVIGVPWLITRHPSSMRFIDNIFSFAERSLSNVLSHTPISIAYLQDKYTKTEKRGAEKIKILIVPGHEPDFGGTEYKDLKERDIVVDLSKELERFFRNNSHYDVVVSRDKTSWNTILQKYFSIKWDDILSFVKNSKEEVLHSVDSGQIQIVSNGIIHNDAPANVVTRLYGINKWANENDIDLVIHVHLNDYPRKDTSSEGKYSGFAIYVPESQYLNSTTTKAIAEAVFDRLSKYNAVSDFPREDSGVVEDQELIAIGSFNTLNAPSMLIEYGYIYETQFTDTEVRDLVINDLAFQTYLGVQDFFDNKEHTTLAYDTLMLPYSWEGGIGKDDVLALQTALTLKDIYPPKDKTMNECPRTGVFGPCTKRALANFQDIYSIEGERGVLGEKTIEALNGLYSIQLK